MKGKRVKKIFNSISGSFKQKKQHVVEDIQSHQKKEDDLFTKANADKKRLSRHNLGIEIVGINGSQENIADETSRSRSRNSTYATPRGRSRDKAAKAGSSAAFSNVLIVNNPGDQGADNMSGNADGSARRLSNASRKMSTGDSGDTLIINNPFFESAGAATKPKTAATEPKGSPKKPARKAAAKGDARSLSTGRSPTKKADQKEPKAGSKIRKRRSKRNKDKDTISVDLVSSDESNTKGKNDPEDEGHVSDPGVSQTPKVGRWSPSHLEQKTSRSSSANSLHPQGGSCQSLSKDYNEEALTWVSSENVCLPVTDDFEAVEEKKHQFLGDSLSKYNVDLKKDTDVTEDIENPNDMKTDDGLDDIFKFFVSNYDKEPINYGDTEKSSMDNMIEVEYKDLFEWLRKMPDNDLASETNNDLTALSTELKDSLFNDIEAWDETKEKITPEKKSANTEIVYKPSLPTNVNKRLLYPAVADQNKSLKNIQIRRKQSFVEEMTKTFVDAGFDVVEIDRSKPPFLGVLLKQSHAKSNSCAPDLYKQLVLRNYDLDSSPEGL